MTVDDVVLAASGDTAAFERVYSAHVPRVHGLARRMAGPEAADELTQDVFVRVWQKLGTFRGESSFGTWLHRLAVNVIVERFRTLAVKRDRFLADSEPVLEVTVGTGPGAAGPGDGSRRRHCGVAGRRADDLRAARRRGLPARGDRDDARHFVGHVEIAAPPGTADVAGLALTEENGGMTTGIDGRERRPGPAADDPFEAGDPLELAVARLKEVPPATDLWPGIQSRLAAAGAPQRARVVSFTLPQLAMAATLLIAVSAGVSWLALDSELAAPRPHRNR